MRSRSRRQCSVTAFPTAALLALALALPSSAQQLQGKDIGGPAAAGSSTLADGKWTVKGSGDYQDVASAESFQFLHQVVKGDGSIIARIVEQVREDGTTPKGGLMIRATDEAGSGYFGLIMTTSAIVLQYRDEADADSVRVNGQAVREFPSVFMRLQRVGNLVSGFTSRDGRLWVPISAPPRTMPLGESALFGIAVSSRADGEITTMIFDNVAVLPGVISVTGIEGAATEKAALIAWDPVKGAVGYNIYRGPRGAVFDQFKKLNAEPQAEASYLDTSAADVSLRTLSYVVGAVFKDAAGNIVEGPLVVAR